MGNVHKLDPFKIKRRDTETAEEILEKKRQMNLEAMRAMTLKMQEVFDDNI